MAKIHYSSEYLKCDGVNSIHQHSKSISFTGRGFRKKKSTKNILHFENNVFQIDLGNLEARLPSQKSEVVFKFLK